MPWCSECDRYLAPPAVAEDGTCPACGRPVDVADNAGKRATARVGAGEDAPAELQPVPWHFKLALGALALYLGFRAFELVEKLF